MPPKGKLPDAVVADFEAWIKMGAPDPRTGPAPAPAGRASTDLAKGREFWSFRPPKTSSPPAVKRTRRGREATSTASSSRRSKPEDCAPVADAGRPRLLRRVTFDLVRPPAHAR